MGSEAQTWRNLKKHFDTIKKMKYQRFEDALSCGIPDLMFCHKGRTVFVELKHLDAFPKRASTPVRLDYRRNQWLWAKDYHEAGGAVLLLAQVGRAYYAFDDLHVMFNVCEEIYTTDEFKEAARFIGDIGSTISFLLEY